MDQSPKLRQNNTRPTMRQLRQTPRRQRLDNRPHNTQRPTKPRHQQPTINVPPMQRAQTRPGTTTHPLEKYPVVTKVGGVDTHTPCPRPHRWDTTQKEQQQTMPKHRQQRPNWKAELYYLKRLWHSHGKYKLKQLIKQITKH